MRLDHLLSREPILWGTVRHDLLWLCLVVFLCLHVFAAHGGWWVWVRVIGLGIKMF